MHLNPLEMMALAEADSAAPRKDLYAFIHKALRAFMFDTLVTLGRVDADDDGQWAQAGDAVAQLLAICRAHLAHENQFIHPAMERHVGGSSAQLAQEHLGHERAIDALEASVARLRACPLAQRARLAHVLYGQLSLFVAHNLEHMQQEERGHNAVLWAHYGDAELAQIEGAIVASIPPDESMVELRWMLPALTPAERAQMLGEMRAHAPAPVFQAVVEQVRPLLSGYQWDRLVRDLGEAPESTKAS